MDQEEGFLSFCYSIGFTMFSCKETAYGESEIVLLHSRDSKASDIIEKVTQFAEKKGMEYILSKGIYCDILDAEIELVKVTLLFLKRINVEE